MLKTMNTEVAPEDDHSNEKSSGFSQAAALNEALQPAAVEAYAPPQPERLTEEHDILDAIHDRLTKARELAGISYTSGVSSTALAGLTTVLATHEGPMWSKVVSGALSTAFGAHGIWAQHESATVRNDAQELSQPSAAELEAEGDDRA